MKKFTKVCLIICAIFVGVGLLLSVIGASLGFGFQQFRRMAQDGVFSFSWGDNDISYTTSELDDDDIEEADDMAVSGTEHDHAHEDAADWNQASEEWSAEQVENLDIQFNFGTLLIEPSDSGNIEAEVEYRSAWNNYSRAIGFKLDQDTLKIQDTVDKKMLHLFAHDKGDAVLTIRIPEEKSFQEVELDIGAACVYVNTGINGEELDITLGAGEMLNQADTPVTLYADEMNLEIGAGHMVLDGIKAKKLNVECGTGQMEISGVDAKNTDVECGVGQITMSMADEQEAYNYEVDCGIGQVLVGESSYSGLGRSQKIQNGGEKFIDIDCGIGEINISFEK